MEDNTAFIKLVNLLQKENENYAKNCVENLESLWQFDTKPNMDVKTSNPKSSPPVSSKPLTANPDPFISEDKDSSIGSTNSLGKIGERVDWDKL